MWKRFLQHLASVYYWWTIHWETWDIVRLFLSISQVTHHSVIDMYHQQIMLCLLNRLFRCRSKKTSKLRITDLCAGNSQIMRKMFDSPHKGLITQKMFPFDDIIMLCDKTKCHGTFGTWYTPISHKCIPKLIPVYSRYHVVRGINMMHYMRNCIHLYYSDIMISAMASQIAGVQIVCSTLCSGASQRK